MEHALEKIEVASHQQKSDYFTYFVNFNIIRNMTAICLLILYLVVVQVGKPRRGSDMSKNSYDNYCAYYNHLYIDKTRLELDIAHGVEH